MHFATLYSVCRYSAAWGQRCAWRQQEPVARPTSVARSDVQERAQGVVYDLMVVRLAAR